MTHEIEETADRIASLLGCRHVGEGHIECGDTDLDLPFEGITCGDVVTNVYADEDDGFVRVSVSVVWRDREGDIVDVVDIASGLDPLDGDSIAAAVVNAGGAR